MNDYFPEMKVTQGRLFSRIAAAASLLLIITCLSSCAYMTGITYYDSTTYKSLTDLKPEVIALYDSFKDTAVDNGRISEIRLKQAKIYEYEKGKGEKNKETFEQMRIIQSMLERHVNDRLQNGKWSSQHADNQKKIIAEAFDIAIKTEALKNKNE
jgi:hypothetical protein